MQNFTGTIIEESLDDVSPLGDMKITSTKVEPITDKHKTPWLKQWTLHKVEIDPKEASGVAYHLSKTLDKDHESSWYADYKNDNTHYIIFRDKVFEIDRRSEKEYLEAREYGLALGIPEYQLEFHKNIIK